MMAMHKWFLFGFFREGAYIGHYIIVVILSHE